MRSLAATTTLPPLHLQLLAGDDKIPDAPFIYDAAHPWRFKFRRLIGALLRTLPDGINIQDSAFEEGNVCSTVRNWDKPGNPAVWDAVSKLGPKITYALVQNMTRNSVDYLPFGLT